MCPDSGFPGDIFPPFTPQPTNDPLFQGPIWMAAGIWNRGPDAVHAQWDIAVDDFKAINDVWIKKGFNITKLFSRRGHWGALWRKNAPGAWNWIGADAAHLMAKATEWHTVEHRHVVDLHYDPDAGTYGAIWLAGEGGAHIEVDVTPSEFKVIAQKQWDAKRRLYRINWVGSDFAALWRSGEFGAHWGPTLNTKDFRVEIDKRDKEWRLVDFAVSGGGVLNAAWFGLWHHGHIEQRVRLAVPVPKLGGVIEDYRKDGFHLSNMALYPILTTDGLTP